MCLCLVNAKSSEHEVQVKQTFIHDDSAFSYSGPMIEQ